jgi:hypothetical protein
MHGTSIRVASKRSASGEPIPCHVPGRADDIPLADGTVDRLIVERTPLRAAALREIARVIASDGTIILRHARSPRSDPHALATQVLPGRICQRIIRLGEQVAQETSFCLSALSPTSIEGQTRNTAEVPSSKSTTAARLSNERAQPTESRNVS